MKARSTPKTMEGAIHNAILDLENKTDWPEKNLEGCIRMHMRDFLAQKFGAALLEADDETASKLRDLWSKITGEPR